jgi:hypothetical protein
MPTAAGLMLPIVGTGLARHTRPTGRDSRVPTHAPAHSSRSYVCWADTPPKKLA